MRARVLALAALLILAVVPGTASAQTSPPPPDWTVAVAGRVWVTTGWSNWNFTSAGVDPLSDLRWRGVDAVVGEVTADVVWKRLVWTLSVGGSEIGQGTLVDEQFGESNRQDRFSLTRSRVDDGYIFYVGNDVGVRAIEWREPLFGARTAPAARGYVDAFVGYQYWREQYTAFGVQGLLFLPSGGAISQAEPASVKVLRHQYNRHSIRVGARTEVPVIGGLSVKALAAFAPWTHTDHEATQYLQTDIKAPTVSNANGGFGVQLEAGLAYAIWRGLSAEAGFRYWRFDSGSGTVTTTSTGGDVSRDKLNEAITERYGPYVGAMWRF